MIRVALTAAYDIFFCLDFLYFVYTSDFALQQKARRTAFGHHLHDGIFALLDGIRGGFFFRGGVAAHPTPTNALDTAFAEILRAH